jgi:predicted NBD/HSP70 family sugar kinase
VVDSLNGLRAKTVRQRNLSLVLRTVRSSGRSTRSELVVSTGLTRSSIAGLVGELVSIGVLDERAAPPDGRPGRPSPLVSIDDRRIAAIGVEVGIDTTAVAIVGVDGAVSRSVRVPTPSSDRSAMRIVRLVGETVEKLIRTSGVGAHRTLVGVGVAIPALVRTRDNRIAVAPNLEWVDVAFGEMLATELKERTRKCIPVSVGNDADLGALAEGRFGAGSGVRHMLYVAGEVGVGGAMLIDGERLAGHSGYGCEFGHVPVDPLGKPCRCGGSGCWETEIGTRVLLDRAGFAVRPDIDVFDDFIAAADAGEPTVRAALDEHGRWVGIGLAGFINAFDPELIVLGGFLARVLPYISTSLDREMTARSFRGVDRSVAVIAASLGIDAALIGAAELAFRALLDDPVGVVAASA